MILEIVLSYMTFDVSSTHYATLGNGMYDGNRK